MALEVDINRDPTTLPPQECQQIILAVREAIQKKEPVSDDVIRYAVGLIPIVRADAASRSRSNAAAKKKEAAPAVSLSSF